MKIVNASIEKNQKGFDCILKVRRSLFDVRRHESWGKEIGENYNKSIHEKFTIEDHNINKRFNKRCVQQMFIEDAHIEHAKWINCLI